MPKIKVQQQTLKDVEEIRHLMALDGFEWSYDHIMRIAVMDLLFKIKRESSGNLPVVMDEAFKFSGLWGKPKL